jgi:hypothetical protein
MKSFELSTEAFSRALRTFHTNITRHVSYAEKWALQLLA